LESRFLGGRPPYGYRLADAGPHPNPTKALDGRRLHRLEPDPATAPVVKRIYREYLTGRGLRAATGTTRMTADEIHNIVTALGNILAVLRDADPADKAKIYADVGLRLTYQPGTNKVIAEAAPPAIMYEGLCPRSELNHTHTCWWSSRGRSGSTFRRSLNDLHGAACEAC
jgi:hypothetical protein